MPVSNDPLIEAAVRNLKVDAELQIGARAALRDLSNTAADPASDQPAEIIARWDKLDAKPRRFSWKWVLAFLVIVGSIIVGHLNFQEAMSFRLLSPLSFISNWDMIQKQARDSFANQQLSPEQELLLFGDLTKSDPAEMRKTLWDQEPNNRAYFSEYVLAYIREQERLPDNFFSDVSRIDPENSHYTYLAAATEAKDSVTKGKYSSSDRKAQKPTTWTINDEAKLDQAILLSAQAAGQPVFETYQSEMVAKRLSLLPQNDFFTWMNSGVILFSAPAAGFDLRPLSEAFSAKAEALSTKGDSAGFLNLLTSMEAFYRSQILSRNPSLVEYLILELHAGTNYRDFQVAASVLSFTDQATRLDEIADRLDARLTAKQARIGAHSRKPANLLRGSRYSMEGVYVNLLSKPSTFEPEELLPGSKMDHALAGRSMSMCLWLFLVVSLLVVSANRFLASRQTRLLARRMESLLRPVDYAWTIGVGLVFPIFYVFFISRFTPYGAREWSVQERVELVPMTQFVAMFLLMIGSSILTARWRLQRRAGALGIGLRRLWIGGVAIFLAMISVPLVGWTVIEDREKQLVFATIALSAPLLLWLVVLAASGPFGSFGKRLGSSIMARTLMPVLGTGMLVMLILIPVFKAEETYWFKRFTLAHFTAESVPVTEYEHRIAKQLGDELREALGFAK